MVCFDLLLLLLLFVVVVLFSLSLSFSGGWGGGGIPPLHRPFLRGGWREAEGGWWWEAKMFNY